MKPTTPVAAQTPDNDAVQGEGDYKSADAYGKSVRSFVESGKVDEAASKAKPASPQEQEELLKAEREGVSHSKGEDPASPHAPARTETVVGAVANKPQVVGELLLPTRNSKSSAEMFGCEPEMSTMMPFMPLE